MEWKRDQQEIERFVDALFEWSDKEIVRILTEHLNWIREQDKEGGE